MQSLGAVSTSMISQQVQFPASSLHKLSSSLSITDGQALTGPSSSLLNCWQLKDYGRDIDADFSHVPTGESMSSKLVAVQEELLESDGHKQSKPVVGEVLDSRENLLTPCCQNDKVSNAF